MTHELKTLPVPFRAVQDGYKTHEIRVNDRDFEQFDLLMLREWSQEDSYSGDWILARVTYISMGGTWGLPENLCVMSIKVEDSGYECPCGDC